MSDLRAEIQNAIDCMEVVNEDPQHDVDGCFWCQFDTEDGQVPDLLKRALAALEEGPLVGRARDIIGALACAPPKNDFDRGALAVARYIATGESEVGGLLEQMVMERQ